MKFLPFFAIVLLTSSVLANYHKKFDHEIINLREIAAKVNSDPTSLWKADTYGLDEVAVSEIRKKIGAKLNEKGLPTSNKHSESKFTGQNRSKLGVGIALPRSYDARQRYPNCTSVSHIRDQSNCGSCWAVSAASVLSDRFCIHSEGRYNFELSSRYILSCNKDNGGCAGGYTQIVWEFLKTQGTVTGGDFQSDEGCQPYPFHPCGWPQKLPCPQYLTPKCMNTKCDNEWYKAPKETRMYKARESYHIKDDIFGLFTEYYIRDEIFRNGPVQAAFLMYADILTYKSGIYNHQSTEEHVGGHLMKIIGWGEEKGVKYWIISNSWGENWGEKGIIRMIRGVNNCGIEDYVFAGIPEL
ncbi:cathepsin B-like cysteine proteinase [Planococcus citri]|uniref:cathepsin B-like cysteine proteinase n=1 Tax=Planococcus citri TaxID=170843 RepID=UPI0031F9698B